MKEKTLKIGHRGAKGHTVENTLASIKKALDLGVDGIEIDVHLCKSGELVVFHDFTLDRLTNGSGEISNFKLSELKKLKIEGSHSIPTLTEVLNCVNNKCLLNIELKGIDTVKAISEIINNHVENNKWQYGNIIVSSFQHNLLKDLYEINKDLPLGIVTDTNIDEAIRVAKQLNAVAIHPSYTMLTKDNVNRIKAKGIKVNTWTVNDKDAIERMKTYHVNGIISDYPERI